MFFFESNFDAHLQTDYVQLLERPVFFSQNLAEPSPSLTQKLEFLPNVPPDFIEAMNDFKAGRVVDLDIALEQDLPNDE